MNSKHVADGEGPKFGKLMPNQLSKFQHPDAPNLKIRLQSRIIHKMTFIHDNNSTEI